MKPPEWDHVRQMRRRSDNPAWRRLRDAAWARQEAAAPTLSLTLTQPELSLLLESLAVAIADAEQETDMWIARGHAGQHALELQALHDLYRTITEQASQP